MLSGLIRLEQAECVCCSHLDTIKLLTGYSNPSALPVIAVLSQTMLFNGSLHMLLFYILSEYIQLPTIEVEIKVLY